MCEDENLPKLDINDITLYPEMNERIAEILEIRDTDPVSMYAAKLIIALQAQLNYMKNGGNDVFIPPKNIANRGED